MGCGNSKGKKVEVAQPQVPPDDMNANPAQAAKPAQQEAKKPESKQAPAQAPGQTEQVPLGNGILHFTVFQASDIHPGSRTDKTDAYVVLELEDTTVPKMTTAVAWNSGSSPLWREHFAFRMGGNRPQNHIMKISVWDKETMTGDDLLGSASLPFTKALAETGKVFDEWIPLAPKDTRKGENAGKLRVVFKYLAVPPMQDSVGSTGAPAGVLTLVLEKGEKIRESAKDNMGVLNTPDPYVVISIGEQTFRSTTRFKTRDPVWNETVRFVLQRGHSFQTVRFSLHDRDLLSAGDVISLVDFAIPELTAKGFDDEWVTAKHELLPNPARWGAEFENGPVMGALTVKARFEPIREVEQRFWLQWFGAMDLDGSGTLQLPEFAEFINAVSARGISASEAKAIFDEANTNNDDGVSISELAHYLTGKRAADLIDAAVMSAWVSSPINLAPGTKAMAGGYGTESEARAQGLFGMLSDWNGDDGEYVKGLNQGDRAKHILVWNREKALLEEEVINPAINLGMRLLYQSAFGAMLRKTKKTKDMILKMSMDQGVKYNKPESKEKIQGFVDTFHINMEEAAQQVSEFETFNKFFYRKLKPDARPIAKPDDPKVAVQPADCRLMVFPSVSEATRLWIKGKKFSIGALLGDEEKGKLFTNGCISVHRLAPQDYHRFHTPIAANIASRVPLEGDLWTVNPVAVNMVDVFTENKRTVSYLESPVFGTVAFVSVGAHMVGSMEFTADVGAAVEKGQDYGFFMFGGSTVVCVWQEGKMKFDQDLLDKSQESTEMLVKMGSALGVCPT